jgi:hypothetical protein
MSTTLNTEKVPGGDRVVKQIAKLHVSRRTVRRVLDEVEVEAASKEHASDLLLALSSDEQLLPRRTRLSLITLIESNCIFEVLTIRARPSLFKRLNCVSS